MPLPHCVIVSWPLHFEIHFAGPVVIEDMVNYALGKKTGLLNSVQEIIEIEAFLLLTIFITIN